MDYWPTRNKPSGSTVIAAAKPQIPDASSHGRCSDQVAARHIDCEHAPRAWDVTDAQRTVVGFDAASGYCQAEAKAGFVCSVLRVRRKQAFGIADRQSAAMVSDVDQNAIRVGMRR
jgi:hypothetical protein